MQFLRDIEGEDWRPTEFDGYLISGLGRVYSSKKQGLLVPWLMSNGYFAVTISTDKRRTCYVHRLIAKAYLAPVEGKTHVNHKNGIKTDNSLGNLEWCTHEENMAHARNMGLATGHLKAVPHMLAATRKPVLQICKVTGAVLSEFDGLNAAVQQTGLTSIRHCVSGKQRETGGYFWRYKSDDSSAAA